MLAFRDPIHGFIHADRLEEALITTRPMQRLRFVRQLGVTYLIFPGAEHSRFSHVLGAMHLAGRVYDRLAAQSGGLLPVGPDVRQRRLVRAAALLHDIGHAPFSHTAEDLFERGIDHEEMSRRLLLLPQVQEAFETYGDGIEAQEVVDLLAGQVEGPRRLLAQVISGELDVDKMDYLMRDSLFCGVRYGNFDLDRLLDTMLPLETPATEGDASQEGSWNIGIEVGGVHALEALVMARYYMFTQVYFNVTGKVLELHLNEWLRESGRRWPADPERFLEEDDVTVTAELRRSESLHARALTHRERFTLAFETEEHLSPQERDRVAALLPPLQQRFGAGNVLVSNSSKNPHKLEESGVLVRKRDGSLVPMHQASHFIRHLGRIEQFRVYCPRDMRDQVGAAIRES